MDINTILSMCIFALSMSITPGPVIMIIFSTGLNYGARKAFNFLSGAVIGFIIILIATTFGLYELIKKYPMFLNIIAILGSIFIAYLGYKIMVSKIDTHTKKMRIPNFWYGVAIQFVNSKCWISAFAGAAMFTSPDNINQSIIFISLYFIICYLSLMCWAIIGSRSSSFISNKKRLKITNMILGFCLILIATYIIYNHFAVHSNYF